MKNLVFILFFSSILNFTVQAQLYIPEPEYLNHDFKEVTVYQVDSSGSKLYLKRFYDRAGLKTKELDYNHFSKGRRVLYGYNEDDQLTREEVWLEDTLNHALVYHYSDTGNWIDGKMVLPKVLNIEPGTEVWLRCNDKGQMIHKKFANKWGHRRHVSSTFTYNDSGQLSKEVREVFLGETIVTYTYNDLAQLADVKGVHRPNSRRNGWQTLSTQYHYSKSGVLEQIEHVCFFEIQEIYTIKYTFYGEKNGVR